MSAWRETELHQTGSTLAQLHFEDFIPAAETPLSKAGGGEVTVGSKCCRISSRRR